MIDTLKITFLYAWPAMWLLLYLFDFKWIADGYRFKHFVLAFIVGGAPWAPYLIFSYIWS